MHKKLTCGLALTSVLPACQCFLFLFFLVFSFVFVAVVGRQQNKIRLQSGHPNFQAMIKITTYTPGTSYSEFTFFILNKGMNSGKPLEKPCPNCFTCHTTSQAKYDLFYWVCFELWQSRAFHPYLIGSVIPYIRIGDLYQAITQAAKKALANPGSFNKSVEALKMLDQHEKQFHHNLMLIKEAKKAIFANYRNRPSFYR